MTRLHQILVQGQKRGGWGFSVHGKPGDLGEEWGRQLVRWAIGLVEGATLAREPPNKPGSGLHSKKPKTEERRKRLEEGN